MLSRERVSQCIGAMQATIPFFPTDELAVEIIARVLIRMVGSDQQLQWLTEEACIKMPKWGSEYQSGLDELRGMYCKHHKPLDGIEGWSSVPGYRASDSEAAYMAAIASPEAAGLLPEPKDSGFTPEEIAENKRANEELLQIAGSALQRVPRPTAADREYVEKLHAGEIPPDDRDSAKDRRRRLAEIRAQIHKLKELEAELAAAPRKPLRSQEESERIKADLAQRIGYKPDGKKP